MSATYQIQLTQQQLDDLESLLEHVSDDITMSMSVIDQGDYEEGELEELERRAGEGYESICEAIQERTVLWSSSCGNVQLEVPINVVEEVARPGDNQPAVIAALKEPSYLRAQLENMDMAAAADHLASAGLEQFDEGGVSQEDQQAITHYLLWMACHDVNEEIHTPD